MRTEYYVYARIEGEHIRVGGQLSRYADLPTTAIEFTPAHSQISYPVIIYWKSELPQDQQQMQAVEQAVLTYCARLYHETAYEGPLDCCL